MKKVRINMFMDWLYNKPTNKIKLFFYNLQLKRFLKEFKQCNPGFTTLWNIMEFIRLLKITYYYHYAKNTIFNFDEVNYSSENTGGFYLVVNEFYKIEYKLEKPKKQITIKITDTSMGSHGELSKITYIDNNIEIKNRIQDFQFGHLNFVITNSIAKILVYFYKNAEIDLEEKL